MSQEIERLFMLIPEHCTQNVMESINESKNYTKFCSLDENQRLVFEVENENLIHTGLHIFDKEERDFYPREVFGFVERYFLEFILSKNVREFEDRLKQNGIELHVNNRNISSSQFNHKTNIVKLLGNNANTRTFYKDSLSYVFSVSDELLNIQVKFPANNSVIKGMDKLEMDIYLEQKLKRHKASSPGGFSIEDYKAEKLTSIGGNELLIWKGDTYHDEINSNLFFIKADNTIKLVFDPLYPTQSFANIFLTGVLNKSLLLDISHIQYGNTRSQYKVSLLNFISYFKENGYELFFGIEDSVPDNMEATLVIYNPFFNHINLLHIKTKEELLFQKESSIETRLFSNIPSDNIKNIFGIYIGNTQPNIFDYE